jgi:hypothetical protein
MWLSGMILALDLFKDAAGRTAAGVGGATIHVFSISFGRASV